MDKVITIKMPKELLRLWLEALRSGKYVQGKGKLLRDGKYCCLGVLEHCTTGEVEHVQYCDGSMDSHDYAGLPSFAWLNAHKIRFDGRYVGQQDVQPVQSPYLPALDLSAFTANDCGRYNFKQIADAIEACAEGT